MKSFSQEPIIDTGFFSISGKLRIESYHHKLGDNWSIKKAGYKGINYNYSFSASTPTFPAWESVFGQTLFLDVGMRPSDRLWGVFGLEIINDYADRFWMPVNFEHRMKIEGNSFSLNRADINYVDRGFGLQYFRGIGHYHWNNEGDLFNLFPEQNEPQKYLRVSGRAIPEGVRAKLDTDLGKLDLVYGPEVIWDYRYGIYANYGYDTADSRYGFIYRDHVITYGEPDERMRSLEVNYRYTLNNAPLQFGLLYQPFRLNRDYTYVDEVIPGTGLLGTKYIKKTGKTSAGDALGASGSLTLFPGSLFSDVAFKYTYLGLVAGNKQEISTNVHRKFSRSLIGGLEYKYRKPLLGPVPLVYEGTSDNPGPALFEPRGPESPFWVGWGNNHSRDWDNREASIASVVFTFDPTPDTWFYRYTPDVGEEWNVNPGEDARLAFSARFSLAKYFSGTDRLTYWDENGRTVWEQPPTVGGAWPTKEYLGSFTFISKMVIPYWQLIYDFGFGDSLAFNSSAYTTAIDKGRPIAPYFTTGFSARTGQTAIRARYSKDDWGPEDWHRSFGQTFDELYRFDVNRDFTDYLNAGVEYIRAREYDTRHFAIELGDYDEVRAFVTFSFGPFGAYFGSGKRAAPLSGQVPERDTTPPHVSLKISTPVFHLEGEGVRNVLAIELFATDESDISAWKMTIKDSRGRVVKTIEGKGQPPFSVEWNGEDDIYNSVVPDGKYTAELMAQDAFGNETRTEPAEFTVQRRPRIIIKEIIKEVPKEIKVTETERGLLVSFTSKVLFDTGKSELKPAAYKSLEEVIKLLKAYSENRIAVEGHTDGIGSSAYNQQLSEKRAWSVANYLITSGIEAERIRVAGYGKDKPVATNATARGREANRRVEVIILK